MTKRIPIALTAIALALAFAGPASADCAGHQQTVKLPTVTAQGGATPSPAPQSPAPGTGG
ncbi:MAG TPA: hypothetical protein VED46_03115 [Alphaproteobacteria bacterium]|nr:hypothetical protein [Alphaproteobacteria bacterium]